MTNLLKKMMDPEPIDGDGKPVTITDATFNANVLNAELPVVLEFEADWCPFCRQMKPIVASVALEHRKPLLSLENWISMKTVGRQRHIK